MRPRKKQHDGHLSARSDHQRHPARRNSGAAGAGAQPDLRRNRRGVDRLCRHRDVRHVRDLLALCRTRVAAAARLCRCGHRHGRARHAGAPPDHRADPRLGADQPAARHRWAVVLSAELRDAGVRHRVPQHRRAAADHRARRHLYQLRPPVGLRRGAGRRARALFLPQAHLRRDCDPRHCPGPRHRRPDGRRPAAHLFHHLGDRGGAGRARCLSAVLAVRRASVHRQHVRPVDLHDLRIGRTGRHDRRLHRRLRDQPDHRDRRLLHQYRAVLRARLHVLHRVDVHAAARNVRTMNARHATLAAGLGILLCVPLFTPPYFMHLLIQILLWGFIYTAWSMMGRFGFVSLGHGAFMGVGAYVPALIWNYYGVTPWIGIPLGVALSVLLGLVIVFVFFLMRVVGHYFALVTLALGQVVLLSIVAARDITGGSLGMTPRSIGHSWYALQFPDKIYFYAIALLAWLLGLAVWRWIDRGIGREALEAISDDEEAAAAIGIDVTREKLRVTIISAALTALGGALFGQYLLYLNPETVSGIAVSLQIVFAAIAGGMYAMLGPTMGSLLTISLTEGLRVWFGANFVGAANAIYGVLLVLFVIFMPRGILGWLLTARPRKRPDAAPAE